MTPTYSDTEKHATRRSIFAFEIFLVSLLYDRICLRIDFLKINYCLNILFIIWYLYVFYSITFVLPNTDPT